MSNETRRVLTLRHRETGRLVPIELPTVIGRSDAYYRYREDDARGDRLRGEVVEGLAALNYIKICSDSKISRVHGLIDPAVPAVQDLNSTNGTRLNDQKVPTRVGEPGPKVQLSDGDVVRVGGQAFAVEVGTVSVIEHRSKLFALRRAFVACDEARRERADAAARLLEERKRFRIHRAYDGPATIAGLYQLQSIADPEGLLVVTVHTEARGGSVLFGGEGLAFDKLIPLLGKVPGRKVLVLDCDGDPTVLEQVFAAEAHEDMLLLVAPPPPLVTGGSSRVVGTLQTSDVEQVRKGLSGERSLVGAFDDARDGLEALIGADTNVVNVDWLKSYRGCLRVVFGERARTDEEILSHSLRFGSTSYRF